MLAAQRRARTGAPTIVPELLRRTECAPRPVPARNPYSAPTLIMPCAATGLGSARNGHRARRLRPRRKRSNGMKLRTWLATLAGAVTLGFVAVPAHAAPAEGLHAFKPAAAQSADLQKVWYRRHHYRYYYYGPRHRYWRHRYYYRHHRRHRYHRYW
jgi:hypothetical protein